MRLFPVLTCAAVLFACESWSPLGSDVSRPDGSGSDGSGSDGSGSDGSRADGSGPNVSRPDGSRPDIGRPDSRRPDGSRPDIGRPDSRRPDSRRPDSNGTDLVSFDQQVHTDASYDRVGPDTAFPNDAWLADARVADNTNPNADSGGIHSRDGWGALDTAAHGQDGPHVADRAVLPLCQGLPQVPRDSEIHLDVPGAGARVYQMHVPDAYTPTQPMPVVLAFHGGGGNAEAVQLGTHFIEKADAEGFVLIRPEGTLDPPPGYPNADMRVWNAGPCCGLAQREGVDDVAFVEEILADLQTRICVDNDRVFATGLSNGGLLSHRLACALSDQIAAIASVAAPLVNADYSNCMGSMRDLPALECANTPIAETQRQEFVGCTTPPAPYFECQPRRQIPVLHFHGLDDRNYPLAGGVGSHSGSMTPFPPVIDAMEAWVQHNGCASSTQETYRQGSTSCRRYNSCQAGADVELCTLATGGHTWPGGYDDAPSCYGTTAIEQYVCGCYRDLVGPICGDLVAVDHMWEFFVEHPMQ